MFGTLITQLESHVITSIDHVIRFSCGFGKYSNPLVYRYMSVALRSNAPVRPSLRRTASLENFLDKNRGEDQIELRKTTLDNKDGTATTSSKAGGQSSSTSAGGGSRKYTHQSRSSSRTAATAPCAPKTATRASRESIKRSVCTTVS